MFGQFRNLFAARCFHTKALNSTKNFAQRVDSKIKGTIIENWVKFWVHVFRDYREVAGDVRQYMKEKPGRTLMIASGFGLVTIFYKKNPDEKSFRSKLVNSANDVLLVHQQMRRESCVNYIRHLEKCYNEGLIRYTSFGIFSVIWEDNASEHCNIFENNCGYLRIKYIEWFDRIVDVGFLNIWWALSKNMLDYDINY